MEIGYYWCFLNDKWSIYFYDGSHFNNGGDYLSEDIFQKIVKLK